MVLVPTALEVIRGLSLLETGVVFVGFSVPFALGGLVSGPLVQRRGGPATLALGSGVMAVGVVGLALGGAEGPLAGVVLGLVVAGLGNGVVYAGATSYALARVPEADAGEASALLSMLRVLGLALAVAVSTSLAATIDDHAAAGTGLRVVLLAAAAMTALGVPIARGRAARWLGPVDVPR
jgi:MFS family permease